MLNVSRSVFCVLLLVHRRARQTAVVQVEEDASFRATRRELQLSLMCRSDCYPYSHAWDSLPVPFSARKGRVVAGGLCLASFALLYILDYAV